MAKTPAYKTINQSIGAGSVVNTWPLGTAGLSDNYNILQKAMLGLSAGGPVVLAILNGTAAAAGTVGLIYLGNGGTGAQSIEANWMREGEKYSGATIDGAGGLQVKNISAAAGTVHGHFMGFEVSQR